MSVMEDLNELLAGSFSLDYWADDVAVRARDLVEQLVASDWQMLQSTWSSRSSEWQERLADVISRGQPNDAVPILIAMIEKGDDELALIAVDSLRDLPGEFPASVLTSKARARVESLSTGSKLGKIVIGELYKRLETQLQRSVGHLSD